VDHHVLTPQQRDRVIRRIPYRDAPDGDPLRAQKRNRLRAAALLAIALDDPVAPDRNRLHVLTGQEAGTVSDTGTVRHLGYEVRILGAHQKGRAVVQPDRDVAAQLHQSGKVTPGREADGTPAGLVYRVQRGLNRPGVLRLAVCLRAESQWRDPVR